MKKVFLMAALVLAGAIGSFATEMNETSLSEMTSCPVKKTTKKSTKKTTTKKSTKKTTTKKSTKKTTTKKTTSSKTTKSSTTTVATTAASTSTSTTSTTPSTASSATSTGSTIAGVLGGLLGGGSSSSTAGSIINGILDNVIGSSTFKQADLCASTWKYNKPGCAFTSENLLAKAGGDIAANKIESELSTYYTKAGFTSSNTYFKFNTDGTFESKIHGKSWKGTYTFDEKTHAITMKGLLLSISGFATKKTSGVSLLFESKKLLTLVQTLTALSGNSTLSTIGNITKNYDGVRVGFDLAK